MATSFQQRRTRSRQLGESHVKMWSVRLAEANLMDRVDLLLREVSAEVIEPRFAALQGDDVRFKSPGEVVTVADEEAEALLIRRLGELLPGTPVIGEEGSSLDPSLLDCLDGHRVWLVDPLDGTANFVAGSPDWALMVALVDNGATVASWIWRPADGVMYMAELGQGAVRNGIPLRRTRPTPPVAEMRGAVLTRFLDRDTSNSVAANRRRFGSVGDGRVCAGVDYPALIEGDQEFVLYWRTLPWDHAPGALLLGEAGGVARRLDGSLYNPAQHATGLLVASSQAAWDLVSATLLASPRRADPGDMNAATGA
jgi:fructose-1,6-bisphosphatase/inositol monophosphatase family enzyme